MGGHLKGTTITILWPIEKFAAKGNWPRDKIEKWIATAGGRHTAPKFIEGETTHIVCSEKTWKAQPNAIKAALAANEKLNGSPAGSSESSGGGKKAVKIVSPDWLEDAVEQQRKPKEGAYSWERSDRAALELGKKADKAAAKAEKEAMGPRSTQGLMAEVLQESTAQHISEAEKRQLEKELQRRREEAAREVREKEEEKRREKEQAAVFRRGAKKARNEVFSDNHHIYMDDTGFKYEVLLTKVDTKKNRNERYALTLYEFNTEPCTYAFNLNFAGTNLVPSNNVIAAIGCNFETGFRAFRKAFKEKTQVDWDDRISFAVKRAKREKLARGQLAGEAEVVGTEEEWAQKAFVYHPPLYGARGLLPEKVKETFPEIGSPLVPGGQGRVAEDIELWMSGANGAGPGPDTVDVTQGGDFVADSLAFAAAAAQGGNGATTRTDFDELCMSDPLADDGGLLPALPATGDHDETFDFDTSYPFGDGEDYGFGLGGNADTTAEVPETQSFGETQMAETARAELEQLFGDVAASAETTRGGAGLDLGASILGKRKSSSSPGEGASPGKKRDINS